MVRRLRSTEPSRRHDPPQSGDAAMRRARSAEAHSQGRDQELGRGLAPEVGLDRLLGQSQQALDQVVELARPLREGPEPDRLLVADPEDMSADEPVLFVENAEPAHDLLKGVRCAIGELLEGDSPSHQQRPMLALELGQQCLALGPARRRHTLPQEIVLEAVVQRVLEQLELDIGQGVLVELELCLDGGHLVAEQAVAFGADAAKVVVEADRVEPADVAVVEQLLDPREIELGVVGQVCAVRQEGDGLMASACSLLMTCASSASSSAVRRARKRSSGSSDNRALFSSLASACFKSRS